MSRPGGAGFASCIRRDVAHGRQAMSEEKKDQPENEKGDKGHDAEGKQKEQQSNPNEQAGSGDRGGHRKRTGGNPDASN